MDARRRQRHFVAVMAKHLPPSASTLRLLDIDGRSGEMLAEIRRDICHRRLPAARLEQADLTTGSQDAIVAYDIPLTDALLGAALNVLRPGGRFIAVHSRGRVDENLGRTLEQKGFVRILVEPALDDLGVLIRGEKPHATAQTMSAHSRRRRRRWQRPGSRQLSRAIRPSSYPAAAQQTSLAA